MFDVQVFQRDGLYVAYCPELATEATGRTKEEAMECLKVLSERRMKDVMPLYRRMN